MEPAGRENIGTRQLIAIVDDDDAVRDSTAALLRAADFAVERYDSGDAFLEMATAPVDCILLDVQMPGASGIDVLKQLGEREAFPPVIVLTGHGDIDLAVEAMKLGALDFLQKPFDPAGLLEALQSVIRARQQRLNSALPTEAAIQLVNRLSGRQKQVLRGMLGGEPNKIIAWKLGLSVRTIEAYRAQLMARLDVRSIAEAVQIALAAGLKSERAASSRS